MKNVLIIAVGLLSIASARVMSPYEYSNGAPKYDIGAVYGYGTSKATIPTAAYYVAVKYNGVTYNLLAR